MTSTIPTPNLDAENERHAAASQAAAQRDFALAMQGNALLANATPAPVAAPAPAGTATRQRAARFVPPAPPTGEPTNADLMAVLAGIPPVINSHADMLDNHDDRLNDLEDIIFDDNGNVRSSFSQGGLKKGPALAVLLTVWLIGYIITGVIFGWFSRPAWVIVPVIALIASAVTLVISNGHRRTTHNHDA
ncbi:hypothetical protein KC967_04000 [Candidatus Saccharibacteria bacterium]|nr:hypothetical protein [Candidatus Saccharibacteria bacterium]